MVPPDRAGCPAPRHGTRSAHHHHGCRCGDAIAAARRYERHRKAGRIHLNRDAQRLVDATGTVRRTRALHALGWTTADIADRLGARPDYMRTRARYVWESTARRVAELYDELSMTPGASDRTRRHATRQGWAPPLAWEGVNLDDPHATPATGDTGSDDGLLDEVAITRAMSGALPVDKLTELERRTAVNRMTHQWGMSKREIAARMGITTTDVTRDRDTPNPRYHHRHRRNGRTQP